MQHLLEKLIPVGFVKTVPQCEQFVQGQSQAVQISTDIALSAKPFGGDIAQRADDVARLRQVVRIGIRLGQPKSVTQTVPCVSNSRLLGLMSRWRMPWPAA